MVGGRQQPVDYVSTEIVSQVTGWCLFCDLCGGEYSSKIDWNAHLLEDKHQDLARNKEQLNHWWNNESMKESGLVFFSSCPVDKQTGLQIVSTLSSRVADFVTDFVWWPGRAVGLIQVESRSKVDQIVGRLHNKTDVSVNGKLVQLKKLSAFLQLEWSCHLFPKTFSSSLPEGQPNFGAGPQSSDIPASLLIQNPSSPLQSQWNLVVTSAELSSSEVDEAKDVITVLTDLLHIYQPQGRLLLLRNYYLRLANTNQKVLLLNPFIPPTSEASSLSSTTIDKATKDSILKHPDFTSKLQEFSRISYENCRTPGIPYRNPHTSFRFNFITLPLAIGEGFLSELLQYLTTFDPRVRPLLTIVHYWAVSNSVTISEPSRDKENDHDNCPEPIALEWMVILFLINARILPSIRSILDKPHTPVEICKKGTHGHDIGFTPDPEYSKQWKSNVVVPSQDSDAFLTNVIELAADFFQFYPETLHQGCWILNPKDGELIKRDGSRCGKSSLSKEDMSKIMKLQESETFCQSKPHLVIANYRIYMLHPLVVTWRLSFSMEKWPENSKKMEEVSIRMKRFLDGGNTKEENCLEKILSGNNKRQRSLDKTFRGGRGGFSRPNKRGRF